MIESIEIKYFGSQSQDLSERRSFSVVLEILHIISNAPYSLSPVQLHVTISKTSVKVVLDCSAVGEKSINAAGNITTDGVEILGRMIQSRGTEDKSAPVSTQTCLYYCKVHNE